MSAKHTPGWHSVVSEGSLKTLEVITSLLTSENLLPLGELQQQVVCGVISGALDEAVDITLRDYGLAGIDDPAAVIAELKQIAAWGAGGLGVGFDNSRIAQEYADFKEACRAVLSKLQPKGDK